MIISNPAGSATAKGVTVSLDDTTNYVLSNSTCGATLAGGASCSVDVQFKTPGGDQVSSTQAFPATLTAATTNGTNATTSLTGTARPWSQAITLQGTPQIVVNEWGPVTNTQVVRNGGADAFTVSAVDAPQFLDFSYDASACIGKTLAPNETCTVVFSVVPVRRILPDGRGTVTFTVTSPDSLTTTSATKPLYVIYDS